MESFSILHIPLSSNNREQTVFVHHSENRFRVMMDSVSFQPNVHPSVAVGALAFALALADLLGQRQILGRSLHSLYIPVVAAAGNAEEPTHLADAILLPVTVDHLVFDAGLHSFPVSERKSRINSFSICNAFIFASLRAMIYFNSAILLSSLTT